MMRQRLVTLLAVLLPVLAAIAAVDTGGPVWTLDLKQKAMHDPAPVAVDENAIITVKPIGTSAATNLMLLLSDRQGATLAQSGRFAPSEAVSNAATVSVALNTEPFHALFLGRTPYAEVEVVATVWDTARSRMLAQDFVRVRNNPGITNWIDIATTNTVRDLDAALVALQDSLGTLDGRLSGEISRANLQEGELTNTLSTMRGNFEAFRDRAFFTATNDLWGAIATNAEGVATNAAAIAELQASADTSGLWTALEAETNRATLREDELAGAIASNRNAFAEFRDITHPAATNALWSSIGTLWADVQSTIAAFEGQVARSALSTNAALIQELADGRVPKYVPDGGTNGWGVSLQDTNGETNAISFTENELSGGYPHRTAGMVLMATLHEPEGEDAWWEWGGQISSDEESRILGPLHSGVASNAADIATNAAAIATNAAAIATNAAEIQSLSEEKVPKYTDMGSYGPTGGWGVSLFDAGLESTNSFYMEDNALYGGYPDGESGLVYMAYLNTPEHDAIEGNPYWEWGGRVSDDETDRILAEPRAGIASNAADIARIDSMRDGLVHVDFRMGLGSEHDITGGLSDYTAKGFGAGDIVQIVAVKYSFPVAGRYGGQLVGDPIYNLAHDLGQDVDAYQKIEGTGYTNPATYFIGNSNSFDPHSVGDGQEIVTTLRLSSVHNPEDHTARELVASAMFNGMALSFLKEYDGFYVRVFSTDKFVKGDATNVWWGVSAIYNFQYAGREDAYLGGLLLIGPTDFQTETTSPLDASPADNADAIERIEETIESWPEFDTGGPLFPDFCQATGLEYKIYAYCIPNGEEETHGDSRLVPLVAEIAPWYDTANASWPNVKTSVEGLEPYFCDTETLYFGVPEYRPTNERNHKYPTGFYWRVLGPATGAWACAIGPYTGLTTVVRGAGQERERLWGWRGYAGTNTVREALNAQLEALAAAAIERGNADAAHAWTNWGNMLTEDSWEPRNNPIWWLDNLDTTCFSACYKTSSLATNYIGDSAFTAITRRHVIAANHYRPWDPATLKIAFVDKDGEVYWRGVSQSGLLNGNGDCWLAMLDEDLPANIVPARIIHSNDFSRLRIPQTNDWPIVSHPAERGHKIEAFHMRWGGGCRSVWWDADGALSATNAYDTSTAYVTTNARPVVGSTWRYWGQTYPFIGGDSGTAISLWVDGQTIVVHTIHHADGSGPNISLLAPDIEEKIRVWGGTTETNLYWADFSAYTDYTPKNTEENP